ncbi:DNA-directed RNA polymerases I and III subunit RPAC1 [Sparganum proliferum]
MSSNAVTALSLGGERVTVMAACSIANIVKTSLGPVGLDKMLVDDVGDVTITNDGATILKLLDVEQPAAKVLVQLAQLQDDEVGDGTTSVVILAAELLRNADELISQKIHPTTIISGYRLACREACKYIQNNLVLDSDSLGKSCLVSVAKTSMSSKLITLNALTWVPLPGQSEVFTAEEMALPAPVSGAILLNKLAAGDEIQARCLAVKGIGRDHAKFSPVSAAYYKLLPTVRLKRTVQGDLAKKLQKSFARGVISIDPLTGVASVENSRLDNGSREYLRLPELADAVEVSLNPRHFLFTVESIAPGHRPPDTLVKTAIDVLLQKCAHYLAIVERPGFASTPVAEVDVDPILTDSEMKESARTQLYGRVVGLDVIFVSPDLRRATFRFTGEDHTLGAALRYCILQSDAVKLCGYCQPHPLEDAICFEVQSKEEPAVAVLRSGLYCLRTCFEHIKRKFKSAVKKSRKTSAKHQSSE